ncbi:hypothetical protein J7L01_04885, partial [bacterium]|nr:hypothetical protein [bacterium]
VDALNPFSVAVNEALYLQLAQNEVLCYGDNFNERELNDGINLAYEEEYIVKYGDGFEPNGDDPQVTKAIDALTELNDFCETIKKDDFLDYYRDKYKANISFSSRRFWKEHLCSLYK